MIKPFVSDWTKISRASSIEVKAPDGFDFTNAAVQMQVKVRPEDEEVYLNTGIHSTQTGAFGIQFAIIDPHTIRVNAAKDGPFWHFDSLGRAVCVTDDVEIRILAAPFEWLFSVAINQ